MAAASDAIPYLQIVGVLTFLVIELRPSRIQLVHSFSRLIQLCRSTVKLRSIAHDGGVLKRRLPRMEFLFSLGNPLLDSLQLASFLERELLFRRDERRSNCIRSQTGDGLRDVCLFALFLPQFLPKKTIANNPQNARSRPIRRTQVQWSTRGPACSDRASPKPTLREIPANSVRGFPAWVCPDHSSARLAAKRPRAAGMSRAIGAPARSQPESLPTRRFKSSPVNRNREAHEAT